VGVAFYTGPVYAVICLAFFPVIFLTIALFAKNLKKQSFLKLEVSKQLGGVVEENLTAIKLIQSFA
jgi:ABC-type multidrug transport system fused ATPase/permease subunit